MNFNYKRIFAENLIKVICQDVKKKQNKKTKQNQENTSKRNSNRNNIFFLHNWSGSSPKKK